MKKSTNKTFEEIMDLAAEIGLQISAGKDCLRNSERFSDTHTYKYLVYEILNSLDALASEINKVAYENLK